MKIYKLTADEKAAISLIQKAKRYVNSPRRIVLEPRQYQRGSRVCLLAALSLFADRAVSDTACSLAVGAVYDAIPRPYGIYDFPRRVSFFHEVYDRAIEMISARRTPRERSSLLEFAFCLHRSMPLRSRS